MPFAYFSFALSQYTGSKLNTFRFSIVNISWMLCGVEWTFSESDLVNIVLMHRICYVFAFVTV